MRFAFTTLFLFGATTLMSAQGLPPATESVVDFTEQIKPLFATHCVSCHGEAQQFNELRLDRKTDALKGGASGPAILPGNSADSRLIHLVAGYEVKGLMPPTGDPLTAEQVGVLRAWIDQGALWPEPEAGGE